ncbi:MAG: putative manganese transporter [bacterium]|nr:putative manganese transporter [bacterium]
MEIVVHNLKHSLLITTFVFVMMMLVEYIEVLTQGKMSKAIKGSYWRQYVGASTLAVIPGCLGAFMNVSFYVHGLLSFGAIAGGMIAASGDEAFVMLTLFPRQAMMLFGLLFILGIVSAWVIDRIAPVLKIKPCQVCELAEVHFKEDVCKILDIQGILDNLKKITFSRFLLLSMILIFIILVVGGVISIEEIWEKNTLIFLLSLAIFIIITVPDHYLEEHIWNHIAKKHLWRVFLWTFFALLVVNIGLKFWDLESFAKSHIIWVLLIASLVAIIPESGPHLIFVMMFAKGIIPFSVLLASSVIQDGHGMLPLLSFSVRDFLLIKLINFVIGLTCGLIFYMLGV